MARVNTYTTNSQSGSTVGALANGGFVVAWRSTGQDGAGHGVYQQRYAAAGTAAGSETRVNTTTAGDQRYAVVAGQAAGGWTVVWSGNGVGDSSGVFGQRYDANGAAVGTESRLSQDVASYSSQPSVTALVDGRLAVSWLQQWSTTEVYLRFFGADLQPAADGVALSDYGTGGVYDTVVEGLGTGAVLAVWMQYEYPPGEALLRAEVRAPQAGVHSPGYIHTDHLGTPQVLTDSTGAAVWKADYEPFGVATPTLQTVTNHLRFPGQYFDAETGLHYNYYRDYDPTIGGYIQPDPVGLAGGINPNVYALNSPIKFLDPDASIPITPELSRGIVEGIDRLVAEAEKLGGDPRRWAKLPPAASGKFSCRHVIFVNVPDVCPQPVCPVFATGEGIDRDLHEAARLARQQS